LYTNSLIFVIDDNQLNRQNRICSILSTFNDNYIKNSLILSKNYNYYNTFFDKINIYDKFNSAILSEFFYSDEYGCIVIDECLPNMNFCQQNILLSDIFFNHRFYNKIIILTTSNPTLIPLDYRKQVDYIFFEKTQNKDLVLSVYKNFGDSIKEFNDFDYLYKTITEDSSSMIINTRLNTEDSFDRIMWYRN